ncbi:MAG: NAD-dependent epimerase/dehydratase family protein [Magnetococcales bacterium]|nr:NAD-dependent epimerase/dehydratase family protein [Magnetococcales bacterium]
MAKILITGGAGFMGGHLASLLASSDHHALDLLDNFARAVHDPFLEQLTTRPNVRLLTADLLNPSALDDLPADYDLIFHLAAIIGVQHVLERPYDVLTGNVRMLENVLRAARRQTRLSRLVFTSTSEVYAGSLLYLDLPIPTPESTPIALTALNHPRTSYMLSKLYGEAMCLHAGLPVTLVRPHNVYGPRMGLVHVIPELLRKAYRAHDGETLEVASVAHQRTFCFVEDGVGQLISLAQAPAAVGGTFNLGTPGPEIPIGEVARLVVETVGRKLTILPLPETPGSPSRRRPDMSHTFAVIPDRPQIDLAEGIRRTFDWYRRHVFDGGGPSAA